MKFNLLLKRNIEEDMTYSTLSTVTIAIVTTNLFLIILTLFLVNEELMVHAGYKLLALFAVFTALRLVLPIELPFTKTVRLPIFLSYVMVLLQHHILSVNGYPVSLWNILKWIWFAGTIFGLIRYVISYFKSYRHIVLCGKDLTHTEPYNIITNNICGEIHRRNRFRVIEMPEIDSPMLFGALSPRILIPSDYDMPDESMYYILKHEITHHFNHDLLLKHAIKFITIAYWWNPFSILLNYYTDVILEMRIDSNITSSDSLRTAKYMKCLIDASAQAAEKASVPNQITMGFLPIGRKDLHRRFYMLRNNQIKRNISLNLFLFLTVFSIYLLSYMFIWEGYLHPNDYLPLFPVEYDHLLSPTSDTGFFIQNDDGTYDLYLDNKYIETTDSLEYYSDDIPVYTLDNCPFPIERE